MAFFSLFDTIAEAVTGFAWRWSYRHRTRNGTCLATVQVWNERR